VQEKCSEESRGIDQMQALFMPTGWLAHANRKKGIKSKRAACLTQYLLYEQNLPLVGL